MDRHLKWRGLIVALVLGGGLLFVLPSIVKMTGNSLPVWWDKYLPSRTINLGLDLKGGIYLAMEVDLDVAVKNQTRSTADELRRELVEAKVTGFQLESENSAFININLENIESGQAIQDLIGRRFQNLRLVSKSNNLLELALTDDETKNIRDLTTRQALETIRNRVDMFGVAEPDIRPQGEDRIIIQLPGMNDPKRAVALIGKTAILEFKLVDNGPIGPEEALKNGPPPGAEVLFERRVDRRTGIETRTPYLLRKQTLLTGNNLVDARGIRSGDMGSPMVSMTFDSRGARDFAEITEKYQGRQLAIVLDDMVYSAPVIKSSIPDGRAVIEGSFNMDEARDLAVVLRAGALPAPVKVIEERTVGPSMGQDSIGQGITAGLTGLALILIFMAFYYRWSGLVADLALLSNLPITLGVLAWFGATLTLPGIFGLVLTIAMAVDANILIFERIREEIRAGKGPIAAVDGGFNRAFWTIFDSNLTTILAALVLYQFGSGPIRGFAVTLTIGILSSMFTAIVGSRFVFDLALGRKKRITKISI